jgi:copper chaperone CopZ
MDLPQVGKIDVLTRTTLQLHDVMAPASIDHMISALQRVPGVLLADLNPATASVVVAHDSAVSIAALVRAAKETGARVTLVARPAVARDAAATVSVREFNILTMLAIVLGPAILLVAIELIDPPLATNHYFLPIFLSIAWTLILIRPMFRRQR